MKLSAPKQVVFWIAVALAVIALLGALGVFAVPVLGATWTALVAFAILFLGNVLKGF